MRILLPRHWLSCNVVTRSSVFYRSYATTSGSTKTVAVGISGGVDSAVTALLLKQQGLNPIGIHMRNWESSGDETISKDKESFTCNERDEKDARRVCEQLQIPFQVVSFSKEYWFEVWEKVVREYQLGWATPNPDILCNRHIKGAMLPVVALEKFGASHVATGHYAIIDHDTTNNQWRLMKGVDPSKDQSYFLSYLTQSQLGRLMFPLGTKTKKEIKEIARKEGLDFVAEKKESMGVCFIGKRRSGFSSFLSQYITPKPGDIIYKGRKVGSHSGVHEYTIGQRVPIPGAPEKMFCVRKILETNEIVIGGTDDVRLQHKVAFVTDIHWISGHPPQGLPVENDDLPLQLQVRTRNLSQMYDVSLSTVRKPQFPERLAQLKQIHTSGNYSTVLKVVMNSEYDTLSAGQYLVFYRGDECIGGGKIYLVP